MLKTDKYLLQLLNKWVIEIYKGNEICYSNDDTSLDFCEWTPIEVGDYKVVVNVTDASGFEVSYSETFNVT